MYKFSWKFWVFCLGLLCLCYTYIFVTRPLGSTLNCSKLSGVCKVKYHDVLGKTPSLKFRLNELSRVYCESYRPRRNKAIVSDLVIGLRKAPKTLVTSDGPYTFYPSSLERIINFPKACDGAKIFNEYLKDKRAQKLELEQGTDFEQIGYIVLTLFIGLTCTLSAFIIKGEWGHRI